MKQTKHCGLSQWELTDRVQMRDFNADNAKVDALLSKLTFLTSRLALAEADRNQKVPFPGVAVNERFLSPQHFTCPEGVTIQNGVLTLEGPQAVTLNCGSYYFYDQEFSQAVMWVEHRGGTVTATFNGAPSQPVRSFPASRASGGEGTHQELFFPTLRPFITMPLTLNLDRGTSEKMEIFNYSIILF